MIWSKSAMRVNTAMVLASKIINATKFNGVKLNGAKLPNTASVLRSRSIVTTVNDRTRMPWVLENNLNQQQKNLQLRRFLFVAKSSARLKLQQCIQATAGSVPLIVDSLG